MQQTLQAKPHRSRVRIHLQTKRFLTTQLKTAPVAIVGIVIIIIIIIIVIIIIVVVVVVIVPVVVPPIFVLFRYRKKNLTTCLLYTSDAADE